MYSASEMVYPKEINHDVLFREGHNLKVRCGKDSLMSILNTLKI